jgi:gluconolactonase
MTTFDLSTMRVVATGLQFPEGPIAVDDGSVLVVEIEGGTLARVQLDGAVSRIQCGGGPNGAAFGPDGAVYVGNDGGLAFTTEDGIRFPYALSDTNDGGSVQRIDLATGAVEIVFAEVDGVALGGLNDVVFDETGWCYVVGTNLGVVYRADPIARTIEIAERGLEFPNGAGLAPDGRTFYVSETYSGRVFAWDVTAPGVLANKRELYSVGDQHRWDGLAVDGAGHICVSNQEKSGISVIDPDGRLVAELVTPNYDPYVTNICFGGPDGDTAYICSSGRGILYAVRWPWPGLRLRYAR